MAEKILRVLVADDIASNRTIVGFLPISTARRCSRATALKPWTFSAVSRRMSY
jgi:hypothetical protein